MYAVLAGDFLLLALIILLVDPRELAAQPVRSGTAAFTATMPRDSILELPVRWILLDSVHVLRNGELLGEFTDWRIAEPGNRIWIYRPLGPSDTITVTYRYRPFPLFRSYARRTLQSLGRIQADELMRRDSTRMVEITSSPIATSEGWSRLNKSGSLIRSVQIGTGQDLALESALNLQIDGRVGRNVDVIAALTDQNTPIQPEGTTEKLSELEKVFVSVKTPHLATTLGDYHLNLTGGQYDGYSRKLSGVTGELSYPAFSVTGAAAASRGQFETYSFLGQESNQGPYPLPGKNGEIGIVVLAGSERIWLNGEPMRRGEGNDYVIDYSSGEITFTSRRLISSESRIVADYEYSNEDFERFYGVGRIMAQYGDDRIGGSVAFISESDDKTRPVNLGFSDSDKELLSQVGDNADSAVTGSADSVGFHGGDYVRADTNYSGASYSIFVFSPRDSTNGATGEWRVVFDDFGIGHGDYEAAADSLGLTYFRWIGPNLGRYRPFRRLPLPGRHDIADFRLNATPFRGLHLGGEVAFSQRDVNTFSGADDADNDGAAYTVTAGIAQDKPSLAGIRPYRIGFDGKLRHRDARFRELSRSTETEFSRDWGADANAGYEETIREGSFSISPIRILNLSGGYGDLDRPKQGTSSVRRTIGISAQPLRQWSLSGGHLSLISAEDRTHHQGDWIRDNAALQGNVSRFAPRLGFQRERKSDLYADTLHSGYRFSDYSGGLGVDLPWSLRLDSEYERRNEDTLSSDGEFLRWATAFTTTSEAAWSPTEYGRTSMRYSHREKDYKSNVVADAKTDVGRIESLIAAASRLYEANIVYEIAKTSTQNQILVAIEVPDGTGTHRREGEQYVPDDQGNYILVPRYTGSYEPATQLSMNGIIWLRPDELPQNKAGRITRKLSSETEIILDEQTRLPLTAGLLLLEQSRFRGDSTLYGNVSLREDFHFQRLSQKFAVRTRYRFSQSLQNQYLNGGQSRTLREGGVRVRARYVGSWRGETEASASRETQEYKAATFPNRDINRFDLSQTNTLVISRVWEGGADIAATEAHDERTSTQASLRELKPHATLTLPGRGRFDSEISWIHAASNKAAIPFELGRGANRGENYRWTVRGTYQFGGTISATLNYTGRQDAGEKTYHTGRLEVRASF